AAGDLAAPRRRFAAGRASARQALAAARAQRLAPRPSSTGAPDVELHPPLRGELDRPWRSVLGRAPDGLLVPVDVRRLAPPPQGDGGQLDAARAGVDCGAGLARARLLAVAEHRA